MLGGRGVEKVRLANMEIKKNKKKTYLRPKERVRRVLWTQKTYISPNDALDTSFGAVWALTGGRVVWVAFMGVVVGVRWWWRGGGRLGLVVGCVGRVDGCGGGCDVAVAVWTWWVA